MLRGHTYSEQVFANGAFRIFVDTVLNGSSGIIKGCTLSNTSNSITVGQGFICIRGGIVQIVGDETIQVSSNDAYCKLVCELDLSKENTESDFEQVKFKILTSTTGYPNLTKEDVFENGNIYQIEIARFKTSASGISDFVDTRDFLNYDNIYSKVDSDTQALLDRLEQELADVEDGSAYLLASRIKYGAEIPTAATLNEGDIYFQYFDE